MRLTWHMIPSLSITSCHNPQYIQSSFWIDWTHSFSPRCCGYYTQNHIRKPETSSDYILSLWQHLICFPFSMSLRRSDICLLLNEILHGYRVSYNLAALTLDELWLLSCVKYSKCVCVCVCVCLFAGWLINHRIFRLHLTCTAIYNT